MAQPVWTLSVDLQARTATFQSGLADAAKGARGSFQDIKTAAGEMGRSTSGSMLEARHGVMLLGEEFGIHLPRGVTAFLTSLGPVAGAMEAAFPFLAIIVGATLLIQHLGKLREEGEKLTQAQVAFGLAAANALNTLDQKLLQVGIKTDELNNDHLGALEKQLHLIDLVRMDDLQKALNDVAKEADATFKILESGWLVLGNKAGGYKESLDRIKQGYDTLLANKDEKGANAFLDGQIEREKHILALKEQANRSQHQNILDPGAAAALRELQQLNSGGNTDKDVQGQRMLVDAINQHIERRQRLNEISKNEKANDRQETGNKIGADEDKLARAQAEDLKRANEQADKEDEERYKSAVERIQESEREKIEATDKGSAARLQAIDAAIQEENAKGLQETSTFKSLLTERIATVKQMAAEQDKLQAEAGKEAAEHSLKMAQLQISAEAEADRQRMSSRRATDQERVSAEEKVANQEYIVQRMALTQQINALNQGDAEYTNKLKSLQNKQVELTKAHEDKITAIKEQAEIQRNSRILSASTRFNDTIAHGLTESIMNHQSWGKMLDSIGNQVVAGMTENAIKAILTNDMSKPSDAALAARQGFTAGMKFPFPVNLVMAPALGAMNFARVMAFAEGGIVPGVGIGDVVPARLTPGEMVLPKALTEQLIHAAKFGKSDDSGHVHYHHSHTYHIHAIDGASVKGMLEKHADTFHQSFNNHVRRMNKK